MCFASNMPPSSGRLWSPIFEASSRSLGRPGCGTSSAAITSASPSVAPDGPAGGGREAGEKAGPHLVPQHVGEGELVRLPVEGNVHPAVAEAVTHAGGGPGVGVVDDELKPAVVVGVLEDEDQCLAVPDVGVVAAARGGGNRGAGAGA